MTFHDLYHQSCEEFYQEDHRQIFNEILEEESSVKDAEIHGGILLRFPPGQVDVVGSQLKM